jgi:hypothetical protein
MWKNMFFSSGNCKKGLQVCIGKWKRPSEQVAWGEENLAKYRTPPIPVALGFPMEEPSNKRVKWS